jgi:hypothetical protein
MSIPNNSGKHEGEAVTEPAGSQIIVCKEVTLRLFWISSVLFMLKFSAVFAQDLEPRAYTNIPRGFNFVVAGYSYSQGGLVFDPAIPLQNADIHIHGTVFAWARSIKVGPMSGKVDVIIPYGWLSGSAEYIGETVTREISGLADPRIRLSVNFIGAPSLPLSGFKDYRQNFVMGGSLQVFLPLGQYDPLRLVNLGTNRYTIKPELGASKTLGNFQVELTGGVAFYTTNYDFYGGKTRSQAPIGSIQGHVNYNFKKGIWVALDGTYYWGGNSTVDGVEGNDLQKNTRLGLTVAIPMGIHHVLKINLSTGVSTRTGSDYDVAGLIWQYRWGKGLPGSKRSD